MEATTVGTSTGEGSSREARRRRIAERGSDRLALITGRIKNLPSESEPESGFNQLRGHSYTASCPPSISQIHLASSDKSSEPLDPTASENQISGSLPTKHDSVPETDRQSMFGGSVGPHMRKCESIVEASRASAFDFDVRGRSSQVTSTAENPQILTSNTDQHIASPSRENKLITLQDVSSSIAATEGSRTLCSLAMAILVVLSCIEFPIVGSPILKSVMSFRPLYLLLLTNITIVLAQLLGKHSGSQRLEQQATSSPVGEDGLFDQVGNALEVGVTLQNVTGALFTDCSIYSITVICGLSLAQRVGW